MAPPEKLTVPVEFVTLIVSAKIPALVTVIEALLPKTALLLEKNTFDAPPSALALVDQLVLVVSQVPALPPAQKYVTTFWLIERFREDPAFVKL